MKPKSTLRSHLLLAGSSLLALSSLPAATFYWDNNGTTGGFGNAGGTWAQNSTSGGNAARWKTDVAGTAAGSATQVTSADDIFNFGTATDGLGAGTITVSGSVTMGDTFYGAASGAVVLSGGTAINFGAAKTITVNNTTNTIATPIGGAATSLTKAGPGTLVLTGANTYTGTTIINGGTLNLGGGTANGSLASTVLTLGGGSFSYTRTGVNTHSFTTTSITGSSIITGAAGNTLNLGTVSRGSGNRFYDFGATGLGTVSADAVSNDSSGIMPGFTVGDSWAVANGTGVAISALPGGSYILSSVAGTTGSNYTGNIDVDNSAGTLDAGITANSLRFSAAGANTLSLTGANVVTTGGILVGSGVGSNLTTISGGTLTGAANKDLVIVQNNTSGGLNISSDIINSTSTSITKSGAGLLTLAGNNTFTGGVFINGGKVTLANAGALNSTAGSENAVAFGAGSTGTLTLNGNSVVLRNLFTNATPGAAVVENASATPATLTVGNSANASGGFAGVIQDGIGGGALALNKAGTGTLTLSGANTYTGGTTLSAGAVAISNATSLGSGAVTVTGTSRINATGGITYANDINVGTQTLTMQNPATTTSTATFTGVLSGSGAVSLPNTGTNGVQGILDFTNTANTFTGNVVLSGSGAGDEHFRFASLGDGGNFTFAKNGNRQLITHNGSSNINFTTRTITIATTMVNGGAVDRQGMDGGGSNPVSLFANDGTGTVSFTQNMVVNNFTTSYGVLYFGGTNTGNNTFGGNIGDTANATSKLAIGKFGSGKWILSGSNTYEGDTLIAGGTLSVGSIDVAANAQPLGKGAAIQLGAGNGGAASTLEYTGGTGSTDKQVRIGTPLTVGQAAAGSILNNGSGALTFTNPTFNPTSGSYTHPFTGVVVGLNVTATRTLTLGGTNTGANEIQGVIQNNAAAGAVALAKVGAGTWTLSGTNTYSGGTTVGNNTQNVGTLNITNGSALGTGAVSIISNTGGGNLAALTLNSSTGITVANNFTTSGTGQGNNGIIRNVTGSNVISGTITLAAGGGDTRIQSDGGSLTLSGTIAPNTTGRILRLSGSATGLVSGNINNGSGTNTLSSLIKEGTGTWTLSGANAYTGATSINGGTLAITGATQATSAINFGGGILGLDVSSSVTAASATVDFTGQTVTVTGTPTLSSYTLLTVGTMAGGDTEPTLSPAIPGYELNIVGNQLLLISTGSPSGYAAWQAANSTAGTRDQDHDNDGVDNGTEHFLGGDTNTTGFTALPAVANNAGILSVTWTRHPNYPGFPGNYGTDVVVETSATLAGPWTPETGGNVTITGNDVKYTFPGGPAYTGKNFARLKVTGP